MTALTRLTPAGVPGRRITRRVVTVTSADGLFYARANTAARALETSMQFTAVVGVTAVSGEHAGARNVWIKNGAQGHSDVTGLSTSTGVATINAATAADIWVAVFETLFQAI